MSELSPFVDEGRPVYLVTGSMGCIGAWVLNSLINQGKQVVSFDLSDDRRRLDLLIDRSKQESVRFIRGDITDPHKVLEVFQSNGITRVIHLAALQVPFCRANPVLGAQVNVVGTVNIFEAARQDGIKHIAYASSVAVYGPPSQDQAGQNINDATLHPATLYGVYKIANEATARIYWQDYSISSTALRPYTVYGVGRDQGVTSGPTKAMLAAAAGRPYHIPFNGPCQYHFAPDVAMQFIEAADLRLDGASVFNLGGDAVDSNQVIDLIKTVVPGSQISCSDAKLPFPTHYDDTSLRNAFPRVYSTPLTEGVRLTIEQFRELLDAKRIQAE